MSKIDWAKTSTDDIRANPHKYGAPTYAEFCANREKWMGRPDDMMRILTEGPKHLRKDLRHIRYFINGVALPTEESVEKAIGDYGYTFADIDLGKVNSKLKKEINMVYVGTGKYDIEVNFLP